MHCNPIVHHLLLLVVLCMCEDQFPILVENVVALTQDKPLRPHVLGKTFIYGKVNGPMMVAIGHGHPEAYGVGPDLPQPLRCCCWCCCCFGAPWYESRTPFSLLYSFKSNELHIFPTVFHFAINFSFTNVVHEILCIYFNPYYYYYYYYYYYLLIVL